MRTKLLDKLNLIIGSAGLSITVKAFLDESKNKPLKDKLDQANDSLNSVSKIVADQSNELSITNQKYREIDNLLDKLSSSKTVLEKSLGESIPEEGRKSIEEITTITADILKLINEKSGSNSGNGSVNNFVNWDEFNKLYEQYTYFLKSLNLEQLAALSNLISLLLFLICI